MTALLLTSRARYDGDRTGLIVKGEPWKTVAVPSCAAAKSRMEIPPELTR